MSVDSGYRAEQSFLTATDYLTFWYRTEERSIRVALILASATLAGAFGGKLLFRWTFKERF